MVCAAQGVHPVLASTDRTSDAHVRLAVLAAGKSGVRGWGEPSWGGPAASFGTVVLLLVDPACFLPAPRHMQRTMMPECHTSHSCGFWKQC